MLRTRVITSAFLLPVVLGSVYFGGLVFLVGITCALLIAGWEFFEMARHAGRHPSMLLGLTLILLILINTYWQIGGLREIIIGIVIISLVGGVFRHDDGWLLDWGLVLVGVLYIGLIGSYFILVREQIPNGRIWTVIAMLTVWATDSGAYLAGTRLGKHGFFTKISPKKTWEGAIGGVLSAIVVMLALGAFADMPMIHRILFGLGISIAATLGDLAESLLKRQTGVKDSSNIMPGHGGLLDRMDSLLFGSVFTYYYLVWILGVLR